MSKPKVAAILTEYRPGSHADVITTKLLEGYELYGNQTDSRLEVASIYLDQVPDNDMGIEMARKHNVPIFESIGEAISLGSSGVNVDGVVLVGEHGDYPWNERDQKLYPRRRFFDAAAAAMVGGGRSIPAFNDKHLSWSFDYAKSMYDTANRLNIPFLAGSSVPVAWRQPAWDWPYGEPMTEALCIAHGGIEIYGFHALEALQTAVERRQGGESGVRSVVCVEGEDVWAAGRDGRWSEELFHELMEMTSGPTLAEATERTANPVAFLIEYSDGLRGTVILLDGVVRQFGVIARGAPGVTGSGMLLQGAQPHGHFTFLVRQIESLVINGKSPYPVERTLLTTGILDTAMRSRFDGHVSLETPYLNIEYVAPEHIPDTGNGAELPENTPAMKREVEG